MCSIKKPRLGAESNQSELPRGRRAWSACATKPEYGSEEPEKKNNYLLDNGFFFLNFRPHLQGGN